MGEQFSLELPKEQMGALCSRIGSKIVLGIRPQDITPQGEKGDKTGFFAELEVIEPLGGESYAYFSIAGKQWVARCEGTLSIQEGERAFMAVDVQRLHIFSEDGKNRLA